MGGEKQSLQTAVSLKKPKELEVKCPNYLLWWFNLFYNNLQNCFYLDWERADGHKRVQETELNWKSFSVKWETAVTEVKLNWNTALSSPFILCTDIA